MPNSVSDKLNIKRLAESLGSGCVDGTKLVVNVGADVNLVKVAGAGGIFRGYE